MGGSIGGEEITMFGLKKGRNMRWQKRVVGALLDSKYFFLICLLLCVR